jgi:hypothetical protein
MSSIATKILLAGAASALPCWCLAASPRGPATATANCARAEAARLDSRLAASDYSPQTPRPLWQLGAPQQSMIVTARDPRGHVVAQMVCGYDAEDQVISLRRATPEDLDQLNYQ